MHNTARPSSPQRPSRMHPLWVRAASHATPPDELARLLEHDDVTVRVRAAANPTTPPADLAAALNSPTEQVAAAAAANPSTPDSSLAVVGPHATDRVQTGIVSNSKASPHLLHAVATVALKRRVERAGRPRRRDAFTERDVLLAVAIHPGTTATTLASLVDAVCSDPEVERAVARHPNTEEPLRRDLQSRHPSDAASNPSASAEELRAMAVGASQLRPDEATKRALVGNPNLPQDIAAQLLQDPALQVVAHPNHASAGALAKLVTDGASAHVRSEAHLALLAKTDPAAITAEHISPYTSSTLMLRVVGLCCPPATLAGMAAMANSSEVLIRLTDNPNTPLDALEDLMAHPEQKVWTAAAAAHHARSL